VHSRVSSTPLLPRSGVRRYDGPPANAPFPLEYAFHLLGDLTGTTIVELGCDDGFNTVTLASLGARVVCIDPSAERLQAAAEWARCIGVRHRVRFVQADLNAIALEDSRADRVLCSGVVREGQYLGIARQIRRILKPGGTAVFMARDAASIRNSESVSRAVGRGGRRRDFLLTSRVLEGIGVQSLPALTRSHRLDAWILGHLSFARTFASALVWEARKEC
jgi:SAM-dependent methyltransferase